MKWDLTPNIYAGINPVKSRVPLDFCFLFCQTACLPEMKMGAMVNLNCLLWYSFQDRPCLKIEIQTGERCSRFFLVVAPNLWKWGDLCVWLIGLCWWIEIWFWLGGKVSCRLLSQKQESCGALKASKCVPPSMFMESTANRRTWFFKMASSCIW